MTERTSQINVLRSGDVCRSPTYPHDDLPSIYVATTVSALTASLLYPSVSAQAWRTNCLCIRPSINRPPFEIVPLHFKVACASASLLSLVSLLCTSGRLSVSSQDIMVTDPAIPIVCLCMHDVCWPNAPR